MKIGLLITLVVISSGWPILWWVLKNRLLSDSPVFESSACNCCYSDNLAFDFAIYDNHVQCDLCHYNYSTQYLNLLT